jgi:hypothetical protein
MGDPEKDEARDDVRDADRDVKKPDAKIKKDEDPDEPQSGVNRDE